MKLLPFFSLLLVLGSVNAQTPISLSGKVTDKTTGAALPYATIQLGGTSIGTTTNQAGDFVFRIPAATASRLVAFSYVGYQSIELDWQTQAQHGLAIALEPKLVNLQEVLVRPVDPLQLVTRSLEKLAENYASEPHMAEGFQREYVTADRSIIQLLEVAFRSKGVGPSQSITVLDARYLEDKQVKAPLWNPSRGGFYTFGWTNISGIESPDPKMFLGVGLKNKRDLAHYYTFEFRKMSNLDSKEVYVIDFDQKKQVRKPLLKGTIYIDAESDAIVRLEHQVSPHGLRFLKTHQSWGGRRISKSPKRLTVRQERWVTTYRQFGKKWYLSSLVIDTDFAAALAFMGMEMGRLDSLKLHSERIVTAIDTTTTANTVNAADSTTSIADVGSIPTLQNFIKKKYENRESAWSDVNFIQSDTSLADVAHRLRMSNEQWEAERRKRLTEKTLAKQIYTARQLTEDLTYLRESLEKIHPGMNWYTDKSSLDRAFDQLQDKLRKGTSEADFFWQLSPLIEQIHCGHTMVHPSVATQEYNALFTKRFPLELWIKDDTAIVSKDHEGIERGSTVISIQGHDLPQVIRRMRSAIASDGFNQTYKPFRLQRDFSALFAQYVQPTDSFEVKMKDRNGLLKTIRLAGSDPAIPTSQHATAQIQESLQALVLKIPSFATNQDFPSFLDDTFRTIAQRGIKSLVIDLRNNQGGRDEYGALLYAYVADQPFRYYNRLSVATTDTSLLNRLSIEELPLLKAVPGYLAGIQQASGGLVYTSHSGLDLQQPRPNAFKGTVYILMNGGTFSAAAEFAAITRSNKRGLFIGEEAGGSYYGNCSFATPMLTLPNSRIRVAIPLVRYELAVSSERVPGHGVMPEHPISYQLQDLLLNRDKALEFCFELIRKTQH
jgi:hypothetical protein